MMRSRLSFARISRRSAVRALVAMGALGTLGTLGAALGSGACIRTESYVYTAQKYDPVGDCVGAYTPVELVNGPGAGAFCAPACLTVGADLYVSTVCPPLPAVATAVPGDAGDCIAALAASQRGTCDAPTGEGGAGGGDGGGGDGGAGDGDGDPPDASDLDAADGAATVVDASDAG